MRDLLRLQKWLGRKEPPLTPAGALFPGGFPRSSCRLPPPSAGEAGHQKLPRFENRRVTFRNRHRFFSLHTYSLTLSDDPCHNEGIPVKWPGSLRLSDATSVAEGATRHSKLCRPEPPIIHRRAFNFGRAKTRENITHCSPRPREKRSNGIRESLVMAD